MDVDHSGPHKRFMGHWNDWGGPYPGAHNYFSDPKGDHRGQEGGDRPNLPEPAEPPDLGPFSLAQVIQGALIWDLGLGSTKSQYRILALMRKHPGQRPQQKAILHMSHLIFPLMT